ncbi:MAG: helix-turn-helix domain-containing protein, partial [Firmicutes bacterium]|nr:helix-turn-helix domain-containing protein [Candidatus Caballimonas caccae]
MSNVRDDNYYVIQGFMINKLKLKGNALNVFAIIYGFSQDGQSEFTGSRQYLCDFTGATKPTIDKALEELLESKLIIKHTETKNGVIFNSYKVNFDTISNFTTDKETLQGSQETLSGGSKETLPNNIYNINNNINNIKE